MTINKMTASFGKLQNDTLEFHDGLNVVCAPNESGKTTWCAFMKAMLYGIDSSERQRADHLPDKLRYAPWSGLPMQGEMELFVGGKSITLSRETKQKNAPMREFRAVYTGTNTPVAGLTGDNVGETLTGATKDVFCRSAFAAQGAVGVSGSVELEKRINAIVSTGDETCSFSETDEQLRAWQRKRRYNRRGKLPELENDMMGIKNRLEEIKTAAQERDRVSDSLGKAKLECERLENAVNESRKNVRKTALSNLTEMRRELSAANEAHEIADDARDAARAALCGCLIGERAPDEAVPGIDRDLAESERLKALETKKTSSVPGILLLVLAVAAVLIGVFVSALAYIAAGVFAVAGVVLLIRNAKIKASAIDAEKRRCAILAKYRAESEDDILACKAEYLALYEAFSAAEAEEHRTAAELERVRKAQELTESAALSALDFSGGDNEAASFSREYALACRNRDLLAERLSSVSGRLEALGDPLVLGSELKRMETEYAEVQGEYEAISLAIDALRAADTELQSRFSPELGKTAGRYMSVLTGGRYDSLLIDRDFSARSHAEGDSVARDTGYLSAGTLDLMYLAVRLAVCKLALPEDASCPLILDDTLVNLDAERTKRALDLLREIAEERQVILFTCKAVE